MIIRQDFYYLQGYSGDFRYFCKSNIRVTAIEQLRLQYRHYI